MSIALVSGLIVAALVFLPVIALVGISEIGSMAIGMNTTAYYANATMWNIYDSFGLSIMALLFVGLTILALAVLFFATFKLSGA